MNERVGESSVMNELMDQLNEIKKVDKDRFSLI